MSQYALKSSHLLHSLCLLIGLCIGVSISYYLRFHEVALRAISLSNYYQADPIMLPPPILKPESPLVLKPPPTDLNESLLSEDDRKLFRQALATPSEMAGNEVQWGTSSMIDAERRLLANALLDISNQRFILLSESCIPLYNFTTIYNYLINSTLSFIHSFDDPRKSGRGRYNKLMLPNITINQWRKGSQWFEVNRETALEIVSDTKYYPLFVKHCLIPCYPDEHYIPTLINILRPGKNSNRSVTWVDWSRPGPHPGRFIKTDVSLELLDRIRFCANCTYAENYNISSMCFLFARKFNPDTLQPLQQLVPPRSAATQ